jgi:hypothetical protein
MKTHPLRNNNKLKLGVFAFNGLASKRSYPMRSGRHLRKTGIILDAPSRLSPGRPGLLPLRNKLRC